MVVGPCSPAPLLPHRFNLPPFKGNSRQSDSSNGYRAAISKGGCIHPCPHLSNNRFVGWTICCIIARTPPKSSSTLLSIIPTVMKMVGDCPLSLGTIFFFICLTTQPSSTREVLETKVLAAAETPHPLLQPLCSGTNQNIPGVW